MYGEFCQLMKGFKDQRKKGLQSQMLVILIKSKRDIVKKGKEKRVDGKAFEHDGNIPHKQIKVRGLDDSFSDHQAIIAINGCKERSACQCDGCSCKNTWSLYECKYHTGCHLRFPQFSVSSCLVSLGLEYLKSNFASVYDEKQYTPIGFDILFPGLIEYAGYLNLNLPLRSADIIDMLHKRYSEPNRISGSNLAGEDSYLAYLSEGIGKLQDWEMVMKHQRKNGSLFNSPSATAAALIHLQNADCHHYLRTILNKFGNAVPAIYPLDINARLSIVTALEKLGLDRHFKTEIHSVLDETYRRWLQGEEEIFLDAATCAVAFHALRVNGYDVSSDSLSRFAEEDGFFSSLEGYLNDASAVLELYRASQLITYPDETVLMKQNSWTSNFLRQELSNGLKTANRVEIHNKRLAKEVSDALKFPYHVNLDRC